jgi:hypothetical protein
MTRTFNMLAALLFAVGAQGAANDACTLLSRATVRRLIGETVSDAKPVMQVLGDVRQSQCFYTVPELSTQVALTLIDTRPGAKDHDAAREQWERYFHPAPAPVVESDDEVLKGAGTGKKRPRQSEDEWVATKSTPVEGLGQEAVWVSGLAGNLYVRLNTRFMRITLPGKLTDAQGQAKARALAVDVLRRWR